MGMIMFGLLLAFTIFSTGVKTELMKKNTVIVEDDYGTVVDRIYLEPQKELKPPLPYESAVRLKKREDLFFHYHTQFLVWMFIFSCLLGVSFGFVLPLLFGNRKVRLNAKLRLGQVWFSGFLAIVFLVLAVLISGGSWALVLPSEAYYMSFLRIASQFQVLLNDPEFTVMTMIGLTAIAPLMALTGMFQVNFALEHLRDVNDIRKKADQFRLLVKSLNFYLFVLAILISGSTITTAFGREMFLQAFNRQEILFPIEFVYLYGMVFTLFLGMAYVPIYIQLKRKGEWIVDHYEQRLEKSLHVAEEEPATLALEPLAEMENLFLLKGSTLDSAKVILSILAPLLTGVLSKLIDF